MRTGLGLALAMVLSALGVAGCTEDKNDISTAVVKEATGSSKEAVAAATRPRGPSRPVLLIGADGLDPKLLRKLVRRGQLPNFAQLMEEGAWGVLLSEREIRSPAIWTTIATGRPRDVHGIYDFVTGSRLWPKHLRGGERRLVTSAMRRVPAIWDLASGAQRTVAVVGWLNTWPAEEVRGVMVSPYVAIGRAKQISIKGNLYPDEPYQVYPQDRWPQIRPLITTPESVPEGLLDTFAEAPTTALVDDIPVLEKYDDGLRWSLSHTLTMKEITLRLMREERPNLTMVYFEGADTLGHRFWLFRRSVARIAEGLKEAGFPAEYAEELSRRYGGVIDRYYELLDATVGELVAALPAEGHVIVVSDHGFGTRSGLYPLNRQVPFTGEHRLEGTIIVAGHGIEPGRRIYGASIYDVMPTLVDLLGLPAEGPYEGHSLLSSLEEASDTERELAEDSAAGAQTPPSDEAFRDQELNRLRSLGYVQ